MGSMLLFLNDVADAIAETHPDVKASTLAYTYSQKPPKNIKPRPNVQIQLCSVPVSPLYAIGDPSCGQNEGFRRALLDWGRICRNISIWNYNLNHWNELLPNPNMDVVEPNIRFFVANNVRSAFIQSPGGLATEFSDLKNYITSNLLWNPNRSGTKLRDEFLTLHYGEAAGPIRDYLNLLHDRARINTKSKSWVSFCGWRENFGLDDKFVETGMKLFEEALRLYPPAWVFARTAREDDEIGGYPVPAGVAVLLATYVTHHHREYWEEPERFDPDRFLPENVSARPRFAYYPFGGGVRQCIGQRFAILQAQLTLAMVARKVRLRLVPGQTVEPKTATVLKPRQGILMTIENR